jgi:transposase
LLARLQPSRGETKLIVWHRHNEASRRLAKIPGIGPIGAACWS